MNNGKICIPVCAPTTDELIEQIRFAEPLAAVIEVRFDCLEKSELDSLLFQRTYPGPSNVVGESTTTPIISTFRSKEQGGYRELPFVEREAFWTSGHETEYCDIEEDLIKITELPWLWGTRICSHHDFSSVPDNIDEIFERLTKTDADLVKIAVTADDITDAISVWKLIEKAKSVGKHIIPLAMGEAGKWTRILGLAHGAFLTYASLDTGNETAPGQITARDMVELYRVKELDKETQVYGIIGNPVAKSLSPAMLNPAFVSAGLNAVYLPLQVKDLDEFMRRMVMPQTREVELNFAGFSVTMPHKESIIKYLESIDPVAEQIGAVNTVKIENGKLSGYNTDVHGFVTPLKANFGDLRDARVAVFGAGGAARASVYALKNEHANVTIVARKEEKARALAQEFGVACSSLSKTKNQSPNTISNDFDIIVDTTPLGMAGASADESLFTSVELTGIKFVYDLVTKNGDTPIIREAKLAGVPVLRGTDMLLEQGVKQFEIWTGRAAPADLMRNALYSKIQS